MYNIFFKSNRLLVKTEQDIQDYYKDMIEDWNVVMDNYVDWSRDGRTNEYKHCKSLQEKLNFMWDKIIQTKSEHSKQLADRDEEIRRLRFELSKWTDQQKGRKPILNGEQHEIIRIKKAEGMSNRAIAKELGVDEKTVRKSLRDKA